MEQTIHSIRVKLERSARDLLYGTTAFFPVRSCYQSIFNRQKQARRHTMQEFYAQFVHSGDLVFDVGANIGTYSELFSGLGATVVAVEPNPQCCESIRLLARTRKVYLEERAVGDMPGRANLRICEESGVSTLTDKWYEKLQQSAIHKDSKWLGYLEVEVVTLDQLAERHGVPSFVKIDVEGYDDHVLRGMSFQPASLSFEFNRLAPEVAMRCLDAAIFTRQYQFNYVPGMEMRLALESWISRDELRGRLDALAGDQEYGDVLARRII